MLISLTIYEIAFRAVLAVVIGGVIGLERGTKNQPAGIRTHAIVCLAACLIMMTNVFVTIEFQTGDPTRLGAQVITGVGFLGAGSIMVTEKNKIRGLTTAAGVWAAAAIGLSIGIGFYAGTAVVAVLLWSIMTFFQPMKTYLQKRSKIIDLYIVVSSLEAYNRFLVYCAEHNISLNDTKVSFGGINEEKLNYFDLSEKKLASFITLELKNHFEHLSLIQDIANLPGVLYVEER